MRRFRSVVEDSEDGLCDGNTASLCEMWGVAVVLGGVRVVVVGTGGGGVGVELEVACVRLDAFFERLEGPALGFFTPLPPKLFPFDVDGPVDDDAATAAATTCGSAAETKSTGKMALPGTMTCCWLRRHGWNLSAFANARA